MKRLTRNLKALGLVGAIFLTGCSRNPTTSYDDSYQLTLPNGVIEKIDYSDGLAIEKSKSDPDHKNIHFLNFEPEGIDFVEKSRITGEVTYIDFVKRNPSNASTEMNIINQSAQGGSSLLGAGRAINNAQINSDSEAAIVIKIKPDAAYTNFAREVVMQVNPEKSGRLSPNALLDLLKSGDRVSIPTLRKYDDHHGYSSRRYKILNPLDELRPSEIRRL
jgi:hypothetical protein